VTEGFLGPLLFLWLGASINLRDLARPPSYLLLGLALGAGALAAHLLTRLIGQPLALAALASAQLGVPVAAATIGAQTRILHPGEAAALLLGGLTTIAAATIAAAAVTAAAARELAPTNPGHRAAPRQTPPRKPKAVGSRRQMPGRHLLPSKDRRPLWTDRQP
jgi:Kef-type K+ transport system membrane component KefB